MCEILIMSGAMRCKDMHGLFECSVNKPLALEATFYLNILDPKESPGNRSRILL